MCGLVGCCGEKRGAFRGRQPEAPLSGALRVEYLRRTSARVRGPVSGRVYTFTPSRRVQDVDAADLPLLLRSRLFRPAG
jgi:hypothetical protein